MVAFYESCDDEGRDGDGQRCEVAGPGQAAEVVILGNPALWWSALVLLPVTASALRRREGTAVVPLTLLAAQFVPWLVVARPVFNFYTAPLVPALALAVVTAAAELDRPGARRWAMIGAVAAATTAVGVGIGLGWALPTTATAAVVAGTAAAALGGTMDARGLAADRGPAARGRVGTVAALLVLAAALALLVHLGPLWLGIPLDEAALQRRWWLPSWV